LYISVTDEKKVLNDWREFHQLGLQWSVATFDVDKYCRRITPYKLVQISISMLILMRNVFLNYLHQNPIFYATNPQVANKWNLVFFIFRQWIVEIYNWLRSPKGLKFPNFLITSIVAALWKLFMINDVKFRFYYLLYHFQLQLKCSPWVVQINLRILSW